MARVGRLPVMVLYVELLPSMACKFSACACPASVSSATTKDYSGNHELSGF